MCGWYFLSKDWILNVGIWAKKCVRSVLVVVVQCFLSVLHLFSFYISWREPKTNCANLVLLHFHSTTRYDSASGAEIMMGMYGLMVPVVPTCLRSEKRKLRIFHKKNSCLKLSYVHNDTETLWSPWRHKIEGTMTSVPSPRSSSHQPSSHQTNQTAPALSHKNTHT